MKKLSLVVMIFVISFIVTMLIIPVESFAHRDGCHSKHSCPSDSGSYTCGDTGNCSECPDNNHCSAGIPRISNSAPTTAKSSTIQTQNAQSPTSDIRVEGTDYGVSSILVNTDSKFYELNKIGKIKISGSLKSTSYKPNFNIIKIFVLDEKLKAIRPAIESSLDYAGNFYLEMDYGPGTFEPNSQYTIQASYDQGRVKGQTIFNTGEKISFPTNPAIENQLSDKELIPSWIKNMAGFWVAGQITDVEFIKSIQWLVDNKIITLSQSNNKETASQLSEITNSGQTIPEKKAVGVESKQACKGNTICATETVTKIIDGDTLYTQSYKIRLSLTNTPEKDQSGFSEATQFTASLCPIGSTITIDQDDLQPYDKYNRLVGKVFCGDKVLNSELLNSGYANILVEYCSTSEFSEETWAQTFGCSTNNYQPTPKISAKPKTAETNCDPSYPEVCIPPYPPDLDCKDVPYKKFKVLPPDPHRFDGNKDGIGCQ